MRVTEMKADERGFVAGTDVESQDLGQATAGDLLNRAGRAARNYGVAEVAEATALSLMEDMGL